MAKTVYEFMLIIRSTDENITAQIVKESLEDSDGFLANVKDDPSISVILIGRTKSHNES